MSDPEALLKIYRRKLLKAFTHLEYSYNKVLKLSENPALLDEESMETWEGFAARFSRVVDLALTKFLRAFVLVNDPGFSGSLRDFVDQGEKLGFIDDSDAWMEIRGLRNITAHDYTEEELEQFFKNLKSATPRVFSLKVKL